MQCENCLQKPAVTTVAQQNEEGTRERHLCADCARRAAQPLAPLVDLLFSVGLDAAAGDSARQEKECDVCGMNRGAFKKQQRLGCAACYKTFEREIAPMLKDMQPGERHAGKVPAREQVNSQRSELDCALRAAVKDQRFEEAAIIRDRLHALNGAAVTAGGGETSK